MTPSDGKKCVREGATLRCRAGTYSQFPLRVLEYLAQRGFDASPRFLGLDEEGRQVLTYIDGEVAPDLDVRRWRPGQIGAAFRLLREYHDLMAGTPLAGENETVCHNDFSPCNVVYFSGAPIAIIDWEFSAPGTRLRDLGHAVWQWVNVGPYGPSLEAQAALIREVLDAYGTDTKDIVDAMLAREREWLELASRGAAEAAPTLQRSPDHWAATAAWVEAELRWLTGHGVELSRLLR